MFQEKKDVAIKIVLNVIRPRGRNMLVHNRMTGGP